MYRGAPDQLVHDAFNGVPVTLRFRWNVRFQHWTVSIYDRDRNAIVLGITLVQDFPLIGSLRLDLEGQLFMFKLHGDWEYPKFNSLPSEFILVYADPDDLEYLKDATI